jgi:hypothetical protein
VLQSQIRLMKLAILLGGTLPVGVILYHEWIEPVLAVQDSTARLVVVAGVCVLGAVCWWALSRFLTLLEATGVRQATFIDAIPERWAETAILAAAALGLFLELIIIRWQADVFPLFSLYKNFSLLSCFLGLGLGYALAGRRSILLILVIPMLAWQMLSLFATRFTMGHGALMVTPLSEQLNMAIGVARTIPQFAAVYTTLLAVFVMTIAAFVPVGQLCGRLMDRRPTLRSYGLNLLGSLAGILAAFAVSSLWTPPLLWFALAFLGILAFQGFDSRVLYCGLLAAVLCLGLISFSETPGQAVVYSPYQKLEVVPGQRGMMSIRAAGHYFQRVHNLSEGNLNRSQDADLDRIGNHYELPYTVFGAKAGRVAIVGAGTGNDVAAALRSGAGHVSAVEIDPAIVALGTIYHPEKPYDDPRVEAIVSDARTFFRTTDQKYDLIVYGLLDSHVLSSHASSIRVDSYVYTIEALQEARARLSDGGILSLSFAVLSREIGAKIYLMMEEAFDGRPPICIQSDYDGAVTFLQKKEGGLSVDAAILDAVDFRDLTQDYADPTLAVDVSTDDWPFFYMPKRVFPMSYILLLIFLIVVSGLVAVSLVGQRPVASADIPFFLMGAGFMLVETKAITEVGLLFGNTWHVVAFVISAILTMAFLANAVVSRFRVTSAWPSFALLLISLAVGYTAIAASYLPATLAGKIGALGLLSCPVFFSGIAFSALLQSRSHISRIMTANLLGAMVGGVLEYNAMFFGYRFLYLMAMVIYSLALIWSTLRPTQESSEGDDA